MKAKKDFNAVDYPNALKNLELIRKKTEAVDREDYETAAKTRDEIIELNK